MEKSVARANDRTLIQRCGMLLFAFLVATPPVAQSGSSPPHLAAVYARGEYTVENITVSKGLQNDYIFDLLQDHLGFLWLASEAGVQKYDGYAFTIYTPDSSGGTTQKPLRLYEDTRSNLWILMNRGLMRYRGETDDFEKFFLNDEHENISYRVTAIAEDVHGGIWVWIQDKGLFTLDDKKKRFVPHGAVNQWYRSVKNPSLRESEHKGIYETWVRFPAARFGSLLQYNFYIGRRDGSRQYGLEGIGGIPFTRRELTLTGDTMRLPVASFNSLPRMKQNNHEAESRATEGPTWVKFRVDVNALDPPLSDGDVIKVSSNRLPLAWFEQISVESMVFDRNNTLWIGFDWCGLCRVDLETGDIKQYTHHPAVPGSLSFGRVRHALCDDEGNLWFGNQKGLNKYDPSTDSFENFFVDPSHKSSELNGILRMTDDGRGNIWTVSNEVKGIGRFNKSTRTFTHYTKGMDAWVSSVTTDRSGIVWIGNWYQGIYKLDPDRKKFTALSAEKNGKDVLAGKLVLAVHEDQAGEIWFGGDLDGLYRYNRTTGMISVYRIRGGRFDSSTENYIEAIFQDSNGRFWIGTKGGFCSFDPQEGTFEHIPEPMKSDKDLSHTATIHEDSEGMLWLVTTKGFLVRVDPNTYETKFYEVHDRRTKFRDFVEDSQGLLWIGNSIEEEGGGVFTFDMKEKKFSLISKLQGLKISTLCFDDGILWCATIGQGLVRYDTRTDTKTVMQKADGLLSNSLMGVEKDNAGNLWISSHRGLTRYDPRKNRFDHYFKEDGFLTNEFVYRAINKSKNGEMILGTLDGIVTFNPDSITKSGYVPPILLTELKIHNALVEVGGGSPLQKHISVCDRIELPYDLNDLSITFASLDFHQPGRHQYSFYLEHFEEDWREPGLERTAYYTNLDPGNYVFKVKGTNSDGVWNEDPAVLAITILPPWWKTWWAYTLYGLVVFVMLFTIRRYELGRQRLKFGYELERVESSKLRELDSLKSRFFANISHEFRTPLTLILGPIERWRNRTDNEDLQTDLHMMHRNARRLLRLINQLLDLSRLEAGAMKLQAAPGNIVTFVRGMAESFQSSGNERGISLQVDAGQDDVPMYFDRDKMGKVLSNLLSNAFKFTASGGEVTVSVNLCGDVPRLTHRTHWGGQELNVPTTDDECVVITVSDTGIGISQEELPRVFDRFYQVDASQTREHEGSGIGLALTKELVELHHGTIDVQSEVGKGTTFTVTLPLGSEHFTSEELVAEPEVAERRDNSEQEHLVFSSSESHEAPDDVPEKKRPSVLIVEDSADVRAYMRYDLCMEYTVLEASEGVDGLRKAQEAIPDLIISDVMMPTMDGFELCAKIKTDERTSHIPVILLTAKASGESKIEGLETGADDYLTKPFDTRELLVRIRTLIEQRRRLQEKFRREILVQPGDITVTSLDEQLLQRAIDTVEKNISDPAFDTVRMAKDVGMSRMLLNTKLKALTGQPTGEFIRTLRLKRAAQLLQQGYGNVTQVAFAVGFQSLSYFAKTFRKQFGHSPSDYPPKTGS